MTAAADAPPRHVCDACDLAFPTAAQLSTHRSRFCASFVARWAAQPPAGAEDSAALTRYLHGGEPPAGLGKSIEAMSVAELRERVMEDEARHAAKRREAEAAKDRAARRIAEQRRTLEKQEREAAEQLKALRLSELEASVQVRAAERSVGVEQLRVEQREQQRVVQQLAAQAAELHERKARAVQAAEQATMELAAMSRSGEHVDAQIHLARLKLERRAQAKDQLSSDAMARVAELAAQQSTRQRAFKLEQMKLALQLEQMGGGKPLSATHNGVVQVPEAQRLQQQLEQDERRLRELKMQLGKAVGREGVDSLRLADTPSAGRRASPLCSSPATAPAPYSSGSEAAAAAWAGADSLDVFSMQPHPPYQPSAWKPPQPPPPPYQAPPWQAAQVLPPPYQPSAWQLPQLHPPPYQPPPWQPPQLNLPPYQPSPWQPAQQHPMPYYQPPAAWQSPPLPSGQPQRAGPSDLPPSVTDPRLADKDFELAQMQLNYKLKLERIRHERELLEEEVKLHAARRQLSSPSQRQAAASAPLPADATPIALPALSGEAYESTKGFVLWFDCVTGLDWSTTECELRYVVVDGETPYSEYEQLPPAHCSPEVGGSMQALLHTRRQCVGVRYAPARRLVVQIGQVHTPHSHSAASRLASSTVPLGWCVLPLFKSGVHEAELNAGYWRLPLLCLPCDPSADPTARPQVRSGATLFLRLLCTADAEAQRGVKMTAKRAASVYEMAYHPARMWGRTAEERGVGQRERRPLSDGAGGAAGGLNAPPSHFGTASDAQVELAESLARLDPSYLSSDVNAEGAEIQTAEGADRAADVCALGFVVQLEKLSEWRPQNPAAFATHVKNKGASPLKLHLSTVNGGARLRGGGFAPAHYLDAGGEWVLRWYESSVVKTDPAESSHSNAATQLLLELCDCGTSDASMHSIIAPGTTAAAPPSAIVVGWAMLPLFVMSEGSLRLNQGAHFVELRAVPVLLEPRQRSAPSIGRIDLRLLPVPKPSGDDVSQAGARPTRAKGRQQHMTDDLALYERPAPSLSRDLGVPDGAWLNSDSAQLQTPSKDPYSGGGAVLVVDGARWLPDHVVACSPRAMVYDATGVVLADATGETDMLSEARSPAFVCALRLRDPLPTNATIVISLMVVERGKPTPRQLGFATLALFRLPDSQGAQPTAGGERLAALNLGAFQLPLLLGSANDAIRRALPVSEEGFSRRARVPCASVLVRLLGVEDGREARRPLYSSGVYDSSRSKPRAHELPQFKRLVQRPPLKGFHAVQKEAEALRQDVLSVEEAADWLRSFMSLGVEEPFDMRRYATYSPSAGLQFGAVSARVPPADVPEGAHLGLSFAICSLYPPGDLYSTSPLSASTQISTAHDWDAPLDQPIWTSRPGHEPNVPLDPSCLLVVDVRCVEFPGLTVHGQGWSVLPVFSNGSVASGLHEIPLFAGLPSRQALENFSQCERGSWHSFVDTAISKGHLKRLDGASASVILLDAQRFGELDALHMRPDQPDRSMIPPKLLSSYAHTTSSKPALSSLASTELSHELGIPEERLQTELTQLGLKALKRECGIGS
ncbi:hypothetical protein AB1Y20_008637 [Prymnesium parvum]|uniref:C2H2-type domain-containing protein n=1 Tax=Prymnesium parvum TaxID=97485 RepID=A0AB34IRQ0_PRYPA